MKIFDNNLSTNVDAWDGKINFVDEDNVMLGFDNKSSCCESFGWFIAEKPAETIPNGEPKHEKTDWDGWRFDTTYFKELSLGGSCCNDQNMVIFRITFGAHEQFIHLFNCHNGYYGHGFDFTVGGVKVKDGCL